MSTLVTCLFCWGFQLVNSSTRWTRLIPRSGLRQVQDGSALSGIVWLHFWTVRRSAGASSIFIYSHCLQYIKNKLFSGFHSCLKTLTFKKRCREKCYRTWAVIVYLSHNHVPEILSAWSFLQLLTGKQNYRMLNCTQHWLVDVKCVCACAHTHTCMSEWVSERQGNVDLRCYVYHFHTSKLLQHLILVSITASVIKQDDFSVCIHH